MRTAWFPLLLLPVLAPAAAQERLRLQLEYSLQREHLSGGRAPWTEHQLQLDLKAASGLAGGARLRETERFSLRDSEGAAWVHVPFGDGWSALVDLAASPTHDVLPRYALLGQIEKRLPGGWGIAAGLRHSSFSRTDADLRMLTVDRYIGAHRVAYTFYSGKPEGGPSAPAHRLQWSYTWNDRDTLGISASRGREVENVVPAGLLTTDVRNLSVFGRYWFAPDWAVVADAGRQQQGNLYRRDGFRLGLRHQF
jgi:YaiO family outer membrane protein